ncbi:MAG TPA: hypothetical protein VL283_04335 [Candidatus Baltobacteraceae bacterium]|nr:hypothetical protein [Candidatus Baltobacteraceae bacterium]
MVFAWVLIAFAGAALLWFFAIRPALKKRALEASYARGVGGMPPCKESCDIHGKAGAVVRYECGHDDAEEFHIDLWGEPKFHKKPIGTPLLCSACTLKEVLAVSLRCGCCGYAILPGDQISLCVDDGSGKKEWRTVFDGNLALCLRWACDAGPGFCGIWTGKGIRPAFADGRGMIAHAFESGKTVIVNDGVVEEEDA